MLFDGEMNALIKQAARDLIYSMSNVITKICRGLFSTDMVRPDRSCRSE